MENISAISLKQKLNSQELLLLSTEMSRRSKKVFVAYFLWFIGGVLGFHRMYLGEVPLGFSIMAMTVGSILMGGNTISMIILAGVVLLCLYDMFYMPSLTRKANEAMELHLVTIMNGANGAEVSA